MKYTVQTKDGHTFVGGSLANVVRSMRSRNWQHDANKGDYMYGVIDRVEQITGTPFQGTLNPETFFSYLEEAGFVTIHQPE